MAHLSAPGGYRRLVDRLNRFPQGAPPTLAATEAACAPAPLTIEDRRTTREMEIAPIPDFGLTLAHIAPPH